ncbi:group 3/4 sigma-70 RNA polymerase sigma factor [Calothrix sp. HK-06]|nr:group 3/4 sigma-70 RNA polymerase sigma factor [Calothrix sp. HK-06]
MKPRQGIVDIFSTFIQLDENDFLGWLTDPKLRRSMEHCLHQAKPRESEIWALYWHQLWQTQENSLANLHLAAYLQEVCYWNAKKVATNFGSKQSIADLFQSAIVSLPKVLKGFNNKLSSNLKGYADLSFSNLIKDTVRKNQEVNICTDWSLLHRVSQKGLVESLQFAGFSDSSIAAYVFAWNCFRELTAPAGAKATRKQSKPDAATWEAIAKVYNTQRLSQLGANSSVATPETLLKWMLECAAAVRALELPTVVSANTPQPGQEQGELLENLPFVSETLLNELIAEEETETRQNQKQQLAKILSEAITQLEPQQQNLLKTYYGQDLTQQQIAQQLGMKQYSVSRKIASARGALLRALVKWSQDTLHFSVTSEVLDYMDTVLEEWLKEKMKANN